MIANTSINVNDIFLSEAAQMHIVNIHIAEVHIRSSQTSSFVKYRNKIFLDGTLHVTETLSVFCLTQFKTSFLLVHLLQI